MHGRVRLISRKGAENAKDNESAQNQGFFVKTEEISRYLRVYSYYIHDFQDYYIQSLRTANRIYP